MEGTKLNIRLGIIFSIVLVIMVVMLGRLYNLQIVNGVTYALQSERTLTRTVSVPASRGNILDRYGRPLITNKQSFCVTIDQSRLNLANQTPPCDVVWELITIMKETNTQYEDNLPISYAPYNFTDDEKSKTRLVKFLTKKEWNAGMSAEQIFEKLKAQYKIDEKYDEQQTRAIVGILYEVELRSIVPSVAPYTVASDISTVAVTRIKESGLTCVVVAAVTSREYNTSAGAHILGRVGKIPEEEYDSYKVLGYAGDEIVGVDGAEKAFENWLHGKNGTQTELTNLSGKVQEIKDSELPEPGNNVYLSIDIRLQEETEKILERNIKNMREFGTPLKGKESEAGAAIVIDIKSSEMLAMANYPTYDLNKFKEEYEQLLKDPLKPLLNRCISGTYSPGSTYKMVTAAAALAEGVITNKSRITDRGSYKIFNDYQPKCHIYPGSHGSINVSQALQKSCNYFFYDCGYNLGIDNQAKWANLFGLALPTGIELYGENVGNVASPETSKALNSQWYAGNVLSAAIGQSDNSFSPLALANYIAAIANGGTLYTPHIMSKVASYNYSQILYEYTPVVKNEIPLSESDMQAIQQGMRMVAEPGGTASGTFGMYEVPVAAKTGSVQSTKGVPNNAVFVAYAPYDKPEIAVVVVVEKGGAGSRVAPIAKDIFNAYFALQKDMNTLNGENVLQK